MVQNKSSFILSVVDKSVGVEFNFGMHKYQYIGFVWYIESQLCLNVSKLYC